MTLWALFVLYKPREETNLSLLLTSCFRTTLLNQRNKRHRLLLLGSQISICFAFVFLMNFLVEALNQLFAILNRSKYDIFFYILHMGDSAFIILKQHKNSEPMVSRIHIIFVSEVPFFF